MGYVHWAVGIVKGQSWKEAPLNCPRAIRYSASSGLSRSHHGKKLFLVVQGPLGTDRASSGLSLGHQGSRLSLGCPGVVRDRASSGLYNVHCTWAIVERASSELSTFQGP